MNKPTRLLHTGSSWAGHADGQPAAPLLAAGAALDELPEPDCPPVRVRLLGEDLVAFRDTDGQRRPGRQRLPAPRRVAVLRPQRGGRPALRLPRLEVRHDRRLRRHALRAGREQLQDKVASRPTRRRVRRHRLDLHGAAARPAAIPPQLRSHSCRDERVACREVSRRGQLAAVPGRQPRHRPRRRSCTACSPDDGTRDHEPGRVEDGYTNDRHPRLFVVDTPYGFCYGGTA